MRLRFINLKEVSIRQVMKLLVAILLLSLPPAASGMSGPFCQVGKGEAKPLSLRGSFIDSSTETAEACPEEELSEPKGCPVHHDWFALSPFAASLGQSTKYFARGCLAVSLAECAISTPRAPRGPPA